VVLGLVLALSTSAPATVGAEQPPPPAGPAVDGLAATGAALRVARGELLTRIATLTDRAEGAHARLVTARQQEGVAQAAAAEAGQTLIAHAVEAFVHDGSSTAAARVRGGVFAEVVHDIDRAVVEVAGAAAATAGARRQSAEVALGETRRVAVELAAAREELESRIEVIDERTAGARAEEERNALTRRLAEEEQARQVQARQEVAQQERAQRGELEERAQQEQVQQEGLEGEAAAAQARRVAEAAGAVGRDPAAGPTRERGTESSPGGDTGRHLDRVARATAAEAGLMERHRFGPMPDVPAGATRTGSVVEGMASWYGPGFDGRPTASGAVFDQQGWTVASKELPLGTVLLVTRGGRSVLVLVNDRGPFVSGRVLDLSRAVAAELGTIGAGVAHVRAEVVHLP